MDCGLSMTDWIPLPSFMSFMEGFEHVHAFCIQVPHLYSRKGNSPYLMGLICGFDGLLYLSTCFNCLWNLPGLYWTWGTGREPLFQYRWEANGSTIRGICDMYWTNAWLDRRPLKRPGKAKRPPGRVEAWAVFYEINSRTQVGKEESIWFSTQREQLACRKKSILHMMFKSLHMWSEIASKPHLPAHRFPVPDTHMSLSRSDFALPKTIDS